MCIRDSITEHVGNPVVTPAGKTIVKVGAKTKVEQSKDSEGCDVIDTTTYEVCLLYTSICNLKAVL